MMRHISYINIVFTILLTLFTSQLFAQEESKFEGLQLAEANINRWDIESIKRGAKFFSTNCMSCHTLKYLRYDPIAKEAGITLDKMPLNVKQWPYGVTPPDLSLETDIRGVNWIYTYLHSFYVDKKRPTGANNLLVPDTAMPNILAPYQGDQILSPEKPDAGAIFKDIQWYDVLVLTRQGSMTPEEFDATIADLVNFLAYAAEPFYMEQRSLGWWVMGFLVILFVMAYLLKKEYWKDVKKRREE